MQKVSKIEFANLKDLYYESLAKKSLDQQDFQIEFSDFEGELFLEESALSFKSKLSPEKENPLKFDYQSKVVNFEKQFKSAGKQNQLLAKAIGLKNKPELIFDSTCGKGDDTCFFAALGLRVVSFERNKLLAFLLSVNLELQKKFYKTQALDRISIWPGELLVHFKKAENQEIQNAVSQGCIIYYDPMYPSSKSSALPKKEMRIFRELVGEDKDTEQMANELRQISSRLVVKRPPKTAALLENPIHRFQGKSVTYDIY